MLCSRVQNLLSAYCDREVVGDEMLRIREHLRDCDACRREYEALRRIKLLLGALGPAEPARPFTMAMLQEHARARRRWLFDVPFRPHELRKWLVRLNSPILLNSGHLAVTGAVALTVLAAGIFQSPQPSDAVAAHVPEMFVSDLPPAPQGAPVYASFYPPALPPAAYPFHPVRAVPRIYPEELIPAPPGLRPAVFIVPVSGPGDH